MPTKPLTSLRYLVVGILAWACVSAAAQTPITSISPASPASEVERPASPRHVLLDLSFNANASNNRSPWATAAAALGAEGVVVFTPERALSARTPDGSSLSAADFRTQVRAALKAAQNRNPGLPVHLAWFGAGAGLMLEAVANIKEIERVLIASGDFRAHRSANWSGYGHPVLVLHAPSAQCDSSPYLEAEWVARKNQFALVQVGYPQVARPNCGPGSQHRLAGLETELARTTAQWLDGAAVVAGLGHPNPPVAWREQVVHYQVPATFGSNQLEMTLMLPTSAGPHPVAVFNHGDIELDSTYARDRARYVDRPLAREFLQLGWAVAFPNRRGVGLSEGNYPRQFNSGDGDATYKARIHAADILPALDFLRSHPAIDRDRLLVTGQSAGGYATMHIAALNRPGVIGAVNFSGGRTDKISQDPASYLNRMMVQGFAEFGAATKIPMLWVFAENDSRYSANTIRASHQAFTEAGGRATLLLNPPIEGDGHHIYTRSALWRQALRDYLKQLTGENRAP